MDVVLQNHEAKRVFPIPDGLKELSSDIVREVLRYQPDNINGFIADYLEAMMDIREKAGESVQVITDIYMQGYFLDQLYKTKGVTRDQANVYATTIQAKWKGYVVRRKVKEYLMKKEKIKVEKEREKSMKIEEISSLGITIDEADRAGGIIQTAYRKSKRGKWVIDESGEEVWLDDEEDIKFGQKVREADRVLGRYDRWEKDDWGEFFELDKDGEIVCQWPKVGQLRKVHRDSIPVGVEIVQFFAMRDLQGKEQYSFLKESKCEELRGIPVGFLIPTPKETLQESSMEVVFVKPSNLSQMGNYTFVYEESPERGDIIKFYDMLKSYDNVTSKEQISKELNCDSKWILPRALIKIPKEYLKEKDDEVKFVKEVCEFTSSGGLHTFRAETIQQTKSLLRHIIRNAGFSITEAVRDAASRPPYKSHEVGRILPVENFEKPNYIQKIVITSESETDQKEMDDMNRYEYIFLPKNFKKTRGLPKPEPVIKIPISRFQGYHSEYKGSDGLKEGMVFIMGPAIDSPDGKPFTYESLFWDDFGVQTWYQLLHDIQIKEVEDEEILEIEEPEMEAEDKTPAVDESEAKEKPEGITESIATKVSPIKVEPEPEGMSEPSKPEQVQTPAQEEPLQPKEERITDSEPITDDESKPEES